ncbi:MAG: ADP-ribosylglycohydrolase family protein [Anaerolineae bacterium]|nr:ADP-ribosylglycohydrolase family protein [Anaerolineae bacterium]
MGTTIPTHAINNAAVVVAALLHGRDDFTRTVGVAVAGGFDTDCNGATAGSIFGLMHGVDALPEKWIAPLRDRIRFRIMGLSEMHISDLAHRTYLLARHSLGALRG